MSEHTELVPIPVVDAHCHVSRRWFEPGETLLFEMDRCGVERAVIIGNLYEFDQPGDSYQQRFFHAHEDRFASVALVDPELPDALPTLQRYVDDGVSGVRLMADARSQGEDPYAIWRLASELGISVSCLGLNNAFASQGFIDLLEELPQLTIALEHFAGVAGPTNTDADRGRVWALARYPQLYMKVSPVSMIAERELPYRSQYPFKRPIPRHFETMVELWGPERLMWGSDFPRIAAQEGYANTLRYPREIYADAPVEAQRQIFGETAVNVFWSGNR